MRTEHPQPVLQTPVADYNDVEKAKLAGVTASGVVGDLAAGFADFEHGDVAEATEQLAKSHGIYLEYNRAKTGREKDYMYMVRISVPGGGPFTATTWDVIDQIARKYTAGPAGLPSVRLTTRQNIQFHWIQKRDLVPLVGDIARTGFFALNGCGDNVRNVMGCPLSRFSTICDAWSLARHYGRYFELPAEAHIQIFQVDTSLKRFDGLGVTEERAEKFDYAPNLLNRKFKIAFSAVHRNPITGNIEHDNCVEVRTNDMGIVPVVRNGRVDAYQVYIGGGQGENGKTTMSTLGLPVGIFPAADLQKGLDAIVKVHQEFGDRKNRHWARLKYVVHSQGIPWYQDRLRERGANFQPPDETLDVGPRQMHHGWQKQESDGKWAFGLYVECGRLVDRDGTGGTANGAGSTAGNVERLLSLVPTLLRKFPCEVMITPNQDLLFTGLDESAREDFEAAIAQSGHGKRNGRPYSRLRLLSGACVGLPTCRLSYSDSEQFEPELIDQLESLGYGDVAESIGITGCERQCFRPATKSIGFVGQGPDLYMLKIGGSEDGRFQGTPIIENDKLHLRQIPRESVATVCAVLFDAWRTNAHKGESLGEYHRRIGHAAVLAALRADPRTTALTVKTAPAPYQPSPAPALA